MIELVLRARPASTQGRPAAWLLPGSDARMWLAELARLGLAPETVELYAVPSSPTSRAPAAAIAVPTTLAAPSTGARALPLARYGPVLFPADARLDPATTAAELSRLCGPPVVLLHPVHGAVGFEPGDALAIEALVAPPATSSARWDRARPGVAPAPGIRSIEAIEPEDLAQRFEEESEHVGTRELEDLPRDLPDLPKERRRGPSRVRRGLASLALRFTSRAPGGADAPTWVNRLEGWANGVLAGAAGALRANDLARLLHLLEHDPAEGLRYALPLDQAAALRGRAEGGGLARRKVDFDLRGLGGGRPGGAWGVDHAQYAELQRRYRELARLELEAGRVRRAAYIHAHLLADLRGAAACLERGGHHREAAALWRDRLKEPLRAAECLANGGLVAEAVAIHDDAEQWERGAELLERVGRSEDARTRWRRAADACRSKRDRAGAAKLLEERLEEVDEAAQVLLDAWPGERHAERCVGAWFDLGDRHGRGAEQLAWLAKWRESAWRGARGARLAEELGPLCAKLADGELRRVLADDLRRGLGLALAGDAGRADVRRFLGGVRASDFADELLARDAERFEPGPQAPEPRSTRGAGRRRPRRLQVVRAFGLPGGFPPDTEEFQPGERLVATHEGIWRALAMPSCARVWLQLVSWEGEVVANECWITPLLGGARVDFLAPRAHGALNPVLVVYEDGTPGPRLEELVVHAADGRRWRFGTPAWVPDGALAIAEGPLTAWIDRHFQLLVGEFDADGAPGRVTELEHEEPLACLSLGALAPGFVLASSRGILWADGGEPEEVAPGGWSNHVMIGPPHARARLLLIHESGIELARRSADGRVRLERLPTPPRARAAFRTDGAIVVASGQRLSVVRVTEEGRRTIAEGRSAGEPLAVLPGPDPREFAVVDSKGSVTIYR